MSLAAGRPQEEIAVGPLVVLPDEHLARADGRALMLSLRELALLTEMARRAGQIMSRDELFRLVWGREMKPGERSVDVYVRKLRVKLDAAPPGWTCIHTHFGFGYRLQPEPDQRIGSARLQVVHSDGLPSPQTHPITN